MVLSQEMQLKISMNCEQYHFVNNVAISASRASLEKGKTADDEQESHCNVSLQKKNESMMDKLNYDGDSDSSGKRHEEETDRKTNPLFENRKGKKLYRGKVQIMWAQLMQNEMLPLTPQKQNIFFRPKRSTHEAHQT